MKTPAKHVIEGFIDPKQDVSVEDNGCAVICDITEEPVDPKDGMFVKLQSWSDMKIHQEIGKFVGRKIRVTIETID